MSYYNYVAVSCKVNDTPSTLLINYSTGEWRLLSEYGLEIAAGETWIDEEGNQRVAFTNIDEFAGVVDVDEVREIVRSQDTFGLPTFF